MKKPQEFMAFIAIAMTIFATAATYVLLYLRGLAP